MGILPIRKGYWGNRIGIPHTILSKVSGKCASLNVRFFPAPRGACIVAATSPKKVLKISGVTDVYSQSSGYTSTLYNFVRATYDALKSSYGTLTPDLWIYNKKYVSPCHEWSNFASSKI